MSLRLRCNRLVAKTGSDCTMPERRTNRHPSAVEFGSLTEFAKGLLQRNPSLIPPREPPTPRVRVGNTILPPAPSEAANNEAVVALRGGRPASARSRESAAPPSAPGTVPPVSVWSERPQGDGAVKAKERSVFFVRRGGKLQFDWVLAGVLVVTGCVVGFAGRRAAERANDSVASAKHVICSPEDGATKSNAAKLSAAGSPATDDGARCPPASTPVTDNADRSETKSGSILDQRFCSEWGQNRGP